MQSPSIALIALSDPLDTLDPDDILIDPSGPSVWYYDIMIGPVDALIDSFDPQVWHCSASYTLWQAPVLSS